MMWQGESHQISRKLNKICTLKLALKFLEFLQKKDCATTYMDLKGKLKLVKILRAYPTIILGDGSTPGILSHFHMKS